MKKMRVGVVRGGLSGEHAVSLKSGEAILSNLPEKYEPVDIYLDKYSIWHENGEEKNVGDILSRVDVVFNALHGYYGEDGKIQKLFEKFDVPYTGSRVVPSAVGMHKAHAKGTFKEWHLKTPHYKVFTSNDDSSEEDIMSLFRLFPLPSILKPVAGGSSIDVYIAKSFFEFKEAISRILKKYDEVLVEEYIQGREATCGVIDDFREQKTYALPSVEIIPPKDHPFFNYDAKYSGGTQEICPGNFSINEKRMLMNMAVLAHHAIGARHYSRSDFIVSPRGIYILEINTLPGLTEESLLPKSLRAVGFAFPDFLDHVLTLALRGR